MKDYSESRFHAILGRALTDQAFRDRLRDPEQADGALQEMGITDATQRTRAVEELKTAVGAIENLARAVDVERMAAS